MTLRFTATQHLKCKVFIAVYVYFLALIISRVHYCWTDIRLLSLVTEISTNSSLRSLRHKKIAFHLLKSFDQIDFEILYAEKLKTVLAKKSPQHTWCQLDFCLLMREVHILTSIP